MRLQAKYLLVLFLIIPLMGQAVVRQGTDSEIPKGDFVSPMIIELPMNELLTKEHVVATAYTDQGKFVCDDASLFSVEVRRDLVERKKLVEFTIQSTVYVRPSYDRKVNLRYSIVCAGKELPASITEQEVSAKEKHYRYENSRFSISELEFNNLFLPENHASIKVVVSVKSDR